MELFISLHTQDHQCLADVGLFVRPKSQQPPSCKESPWKLNFFHNGRLNARSRSNFSLRGEDTSYVKHQLQPSTSSGWWHTHCERAPLSNISRAKLLFRDHTAPSCIKLEDQQHRTLPTYTTKFRALL